MKAIVINTGYSELINLINQNYRNLQGVTSDEAKYQEPVLNNQNEGLIYVIESYSYTNQLLLSSGITQAQINAATDIDLNQFLNTWLEPAWNVRVKLTYIQSSELAYDFPEWIATLKSEPINPIYNYDSYKIIYMHDMPDEIKTLLINHGAVIEQKSDT